MHQAGSDTLCLMYTKEAVIRALLTCLQPSEIMTDFINLTLDDEQSVDSFGLPDSSYE